MFTLPLFVGQITPVETDTTERRSPPPRQRPKRAPFEQDFDVTLGDGTPKCTIPEMCMDGYTLKDFLASGTYGSVYEACKPKGTCKYVIKFQKLGKGSTFNSEVEITKKMSKLKIGPEHVGAFKCKEKNVGIIVSEKWDGELKHKELKTLSPHLISTLEDQINKLHKEGYIHADIKPSNILVRRSTLGKVTDLTLADFGITDTPEGLKKKNTDWIDRLYKYHAEMSPNSHYYADNKIYNHHVRKDPKLLDMGLIYFLKKRIKQKPCC